MITRHRKIYTNTAGSKSYVWFNSKGNILETSCILTDMSNNRKIFEGNFVSDIDKKTTYKNEDGRVLIINDSEDKSERKIIIKDSENASNNSLEIYIETVDTVRLLIYGTESNHNRYKLEVKDKCDLVDDSFNNLDAYNVRDALISKLSILKGELWYKYNFGLPLIDKVKIKGIMDAEVLNIINGIQEIKRVVSFNSVIENRKYILNFSVETIYSNEKTSVNLKI